MINENCLLILFRVLVLGGVEVWKTDGNKAQRSAYCLTSSVWIWVHSTSSQLCFTRSYGKRESLLIAFIYSAILRSRADSLRSHVILHE